MVDISWLDDVRRQLAKQALPPSYTQRFMDELSDHLEDLKEENMSTEAVLRSQLGEPEEVAKAAAAAYRRRSFLGRHPAAAFLVFAVSPIVSLSVVAVAMIWGLFMAGDALDDTIIDPMLKRAGPALPYIVSILTVVLPSIFVSILYCRLANRLCLGKKWMLVACIVVAMIAALPHYSARLSDVPGQSVLRIGSPPLPWPDANSGSVFMGILDGIKDLASFFASTSQLVQLVAPLTVGCWFLWRKGNRGRPPCVA